MTTTTITTNNGIITRMTIIHHDDYRSYYWGLAAVVGFALFAWVLRKIFWQQDSN